MTRFATFHSAASALHDTGPHHPEHQGRIDAALRGVSDASPDIPRNASAAIDVDRWIVQTHAPEYVEEFAEAVERGLPLFQSPDNPMSRGTYEASREAVRSALSAAEEIWLRGSLDRAFVVARPPGHHAERAQAMGFCFFNTIAIVAERLRAIAGIDRVFIFDWDVHHGNGTQHLFESRSDVFYASMHRFPFYPGTGSSRERGEGEGEGFTLNLPMTTSTTEADWLRAFENQLLPALDAFAPQAILISAGFDAHRRDPLGGMRLGEEAFGFMTRGMLQAAENHCDRRVLSLLEGGYDMDGLRASVAEHVNAMLS